MLGSIDREVRRGVRAGPSRVVIFSAHAEREREFAVGVWDLDTGLFLHALDTGPEMSGRIATSRDGRVAIVQTRRQVTVFQVATGERGATVDGSGVYALADDGSRFLAGVGETEVGSVRVYGLDGTLERELSPVGATIRDALFTHDGGGVIAGLSDGTLVCWDLASGSVRWRVAVHKGDVTDMTRAHDDDTVYSTGLDGRLRATAPGGRARWSAFLHRPRSAEQWYGASADTIFLSPDGSAIAVYDRHTRVCVFEVSSGRERTTFDGHDGDVRCLAFSPDGRLLASGAEDGDVRVCEVATGATTWVFEVDEEGVTSMEFVPDRPALRTVGRDGVVRSWSLTSGMELEAHTEGAATITETHGSRDGSLVLLLAGHRLALWNLERSPREVWSKDQWPQRVMAMAFAADGEHALVGRAGQGSERANESRLDVLVLANGKRRSASRPLRGPLLDLCETDAGPVSVAIDGDDLIVTEEWGDRRERRCPKGARKASRVCVSADGRLLLVATWHYVDLWHLAVPGWLARVDLGPSEEWVTSVAIAPFTDALAIGTNTGRVHVYEGRELEASSPLSEHESG